MEPQAVALRRLSPLPQHNPAAGAGHCRCVAWMALPVPPGQQGKHYRFPALHRQRQAVAPVDPDPTTALPQFLHQHGVPAATTGHHQLQRAGTALAGPPLQIRRHHRCRERGEGGDAVIRLEVRQLSPAGAADRLVRTLPARLISGLVAGNSPPEASVGLRLPPLGQQRRGVHRHRSVRCRR